MVSRRFIFLLLCSFLNYDSVLGLQYIVGTEDQLHWVLGSVSPGDEILIANLTLPIKYGLTAGLNGEWGSPIRVRGIGSASALQGNWTGFDLLTVFGSNWVFESFSMIGTYYNAVFIWPLSVNITIQNMNFSGGRNGVGAAVTTHADNILIQQNTFHCNNTGVSVHGWEYEDLNPGVERIIVIKNNTFNTDKDARNTGVSLSGVQAIMENNIFCIHDSGVWRNFAVATDSRVIFTGNIGTRASMAGFFVSLDQTLFPLDTQGYAFVRNHCNVGDMGVWCIEIEESPLFNITAITSDNTYENARGLTNMPL